MNRRRYGATRYGKDRPDPRKSLVGFQVGGVAYAIPIEVVREIINPIPLTHLPHAPPSIAGVADHRGEVITVIDLRVHFDAAPACVTESEPSRSRREKWILLQDGPALLGLMVDSVTDVSGTGGQELRDPPQGSGQDVRGFLGVITRDGTLTYVLDTKKFSSMAGALEHVTASAHGLNS